MSFDEIPDLVLLKIFCFLPPRDFIRLGGVNRRFQQILKVAVESKLKSIDFEDEIDNIFHRKNREITPEQFGCLLEKCENGLEKIKFRCGRPELVEIFGRFSFPKLVELDLTRNAVSVDQFERMIVQNRNIEILKSQSYRCYVSYPPPDSEINGVDASGVISEKLVTVDVAWAHSHLFASTPARWRNLNSLWIKSVDWGGAFATWALRPPYDTPTETVLGEFFASCTKLTKFSTNSAVLSLDLTSVQSFWRLRLREIAITVRFHTAEAVLAKFIDSFPDMEVVSLDGGILSY